jgi:hypothetical protein
MRLFVDMDGVLADFDAHHESLFGYRPDRIWRKANWKGIGSMKDFYLHIPPMKDMDELWDFIEPLHPIVLTGIPFSVPEAAANKRVWVRKHLGPHVEVRCCLSKEKSMHAKPGDVLIDDWEKYKHLWEKTGGIWITHTCVASTIEELRKLLPSGDSHLRKRHGNTSTV